MPKYRILSLTGKYRESLPLIYQILFSHDVSLEATYRRLIELEIYHGAFICFNESKPLFAYNTPGFNLNIERINSLPKLRRGNLMSIHGIPVICYYKRFKSGNFLVS
jgi:hypothetical protein